MRNAVVLLAVVSLLAAACGRGDTPSASTEPEPTTSTTDAPAPATTSPTTAQTATTTSSTAASSTTSTTVSGPATITVEVTGGEVSGRDRYQVALGEPVLLVVQSDVADEVHIHGYDLYFDVAAGSEATFEFIPDIPGIFEVELESSHVQLLELEVAP